LEVAKGPPVFGERRKKNAH